jgi:uncharacterized protein
VLNVVDFGAFVDVGLSDSGLVHVSQLRADFVRDPHEVVAVGDQVDCWVTAIDTERRRVALTMIEPGSERPKHEKSSSRKPRRRGKKPAEGEAAAATTGEQKPAEGQGQGERRHQRRDRGEGGHRGDRGGQGGGGNRGQKRGRHGHREEQPRGGSGAFERRAKREVVPITKEMEEGKEAMRSFSDLLQFVKKKSPKDEGESGGKKKN